MTRTATIIGLAAVAAACSRSEPRTPGVPSTLQLVDSLDHVDRLAREPMVVRHPSGALFLTGYWDSIPPVWKSTDQGKTWTRLAVGSEADGAAGNSDSDLAVGPDGTVYMITLVFDRTTARGRSVHVATSHDVGATWKWTRLSDTPRDDRPWIDVAPDGLVHAIWNDGAGVSHATSSDSGRTWTELGRVYDQGHSSHLAVGPNGEVAVRLIPPSAANSAYHPGVDFVAVSLDRGQTWTRHPAPGGLEFKPMWDSTVTPPRFQFPPQPRWVEPLAFDSTGALYSFWAKGNAVWLGRSRDRGASWTTWQVAATDTTPYFPYLVAAGKGRIAASWFSGHGDALRGNVAWIETAADSSAPTVTRAAPFPIQSWSLPGFGPPDQEDTAGEYLPIVLLPDGSFGVVAPLQQVAANRLGFSWRRYRLTAP